MTKAIDGADLHPKDIPAALRLRLETNVDRVDSGCLLWRGPFFPNSYGMVWLRTDFGGRPFGAHRIAFVLHHGPLKAGTVVRHTCDTKPCIDGEHLVSGSQQQNRQEYFLRQTEIGLVVPKIRDDFEEGRTMADIVREHGFERGFVADIIMNRRYHDADYRPPTSLDNLRRRRDARLVSANLKLTDKLLTYARREKARGRTYQAIADELEVSMSTLWEALNGRCQRTAK
jgi:hypothetical protein